MDLYIQQLISEVEELRSLSQSVSSVQYGEQHIKSGSQKNEAPFVNYLFKINELEIKGKLQVQVSHPDKPVSACCN